MNEIDYELELARLENIKAFLEKNYQAKDGAKTQAWSEGNYDDVFYDGEARGYAMALHDLAKEIGIEVEPLAPQEY